jgi:DNA polymerase-4
MKTRIILHIDFDSFFASVEQQFDPTLRGKPVGVTARNGRNCIIAASREAKKLGIKTGSRRYDALKVCPNMAFVSADFTKYWEISQKFLQVCKKFSPFIEVFSIDELFMDITMTAHLFGGPQQLIKKLKQNLAIEVGECITVSVGISYNKLLAKLGSGLKKPDGIVEIKPSQLPYVYSLAKLQDICGIGRRIENRLNNMGIFTLTQLSKTALTSLVAEFGNVEGNFLYNVGQGIDLRELVSYTVAEEAKSISRNYCLPKNEYDNRIVMQNVYELCEELGIKLRRLGLRARHAGLYLRGKESFAVQKTVDHYFDTGKDMFNLLMLLIHRELPYIDNLTAELSYVRQMSVWVSFLRDEHATARNIFYENEGYEKVIRTVDKLNEKYGNHTIRNGFLLYADKLTTVPNGYMADRYERMKLAKSE